MAPPPTKIRDPRARAAFLLALLVLPLALLGPGLLPGRTLLPQHPAALAPLATEDPLRAQAAAEDANLVASDSLFPLLTDAMRLGRGLRSGSAPAWVPEQGLGLPYAGQSMVSAWSPPNLLHAVLPPRVAPGAAALLRLFLAGIGMALFLRARGLSRAAVLFGAVAFQAGGFGLTNLHYGPKVDAALWLPYCLAAIEGMRSGARFAGAGLSLGLALSFGAGFPPIACFVAATCVLYGALRGRSDPPLLARLALHAALGLGLSALVLAPTLEASRRSLRGPKDVDAIEAQALPAAALSTTVVAGLFGAPTDPFFAPDHPLAWWLLRPEEASKAEGANVLEWNAHTGIAVLLLAFAGLIAAPRRALPPAMLLALALGFAFAWPGARLAYALPGFDLGAPGRVLAVAWFAWPWLAALGVDALRNGRLTAPVVAIATGLLCAAVGQGLWLGVDAGAWPQRVEASIAERFDVAPAEVRARIPRAQFVRAAERLSLEGRATFAFSAAAVLCALGALIARLRGREAHGGGVSWLAPWLLLVGAEGLRQARAHLAPRRVDGPLFPPSPALDAVREAAGTGRVLRIDQSANGISDVLDLARPNLLQAYGIRDATPYVVFPPRDVTEAWTRTDPGARYRTGVSRLSDPRQVGHPLFDVLGVTCVLSRTPLDAPRLSLHYALQDFHVYRRAGPDGEPLTEARVMPFALDAPAGTAVLGLAQGAVDPSSTLVVDRPVPFNGVDDPGTRVPADWRAGTTRVERPDPETVLIEVTGSSGGWLVLHDAHAPGWSAQVDGGEVEILPAWGLVRAVRVPPGDTRVRFEYGASTTARRGKLLSALSLVLLIFVSLRGRSAQDDVS